jgi:hypothetical protein
MGRTSPRARALAGITVASVAFVILCAITYNRIDEDAYIYFRVAEHIASGQGYVFNVGDPPTETGSSPLWQLALAAGALLPIELATQAKIAGIVLGIGCLLLLHGLTATTVSDPWLRAVPSLLLAVQGTFVHWVQSGMETALCTFLLLWYAKWMLEAPSGRRWIVPAALLAVARPESPVLLLGALTLLTSRDGRKEWKRWVAGAGVVGLVLVATVALRLLTFGDLVAHPFYLKAGSRSPLWVAHRALVDGRVYLLMLPVAAAFFVPRYWSRERRFLLATGAIAMAWGLLVPDGLKPYFRHFVPALPFVFWASADSVAFWLGMASRPRLRAWLSPAIGVALLLVVALDPALPAAGGRSLDNPIHEAFRSWAGAPGSALAELREKIASTTAPTRVTPGPFELGQNYQALVGQFVAHNYPAGITVIYDQMGQTPYFAGHDKRFLDTLGLTDRVVSAYWFARRAQHDPLARAYLRLRDTLRAGLGMEPRASPTLIDVRAYLLEARPALVLYNVVAGRQLEEIVLADPRFRRQYEARFVLRPVGHPLGLIRLYESRTAPRREVDSLWTPEFLDVEAVADVGSRRPRAEKRIRRPAGRPHVDAPEHASPGRR